MLLLIQKHKNSVRIKAPNSVNASKRKHKNQINHYNKQRRVLMATQVYIHIYLQVAHNFDTFYATKLKFVMIFTDQGLRLHGIVAPGACPWAGPGSECITGHIEHMQNGNRIISLAPLLALES